MADRPNEPQNQIFKPRIKSATKAVDPNQLLYAEDLLHYYKFALDGRSSQEILQQWAAEYPVDWIRQAIVEALYQGRYKTVSVDQILQIWQRRQQAQPRFDEDFEQMIRKRLPQNLAHRPAESTSAVAALAADIQSNSHLPHTESTSNSADSSLAELTQFVQTRRSRQSSVDAVIDHAEATVDQAANQAKQQITHETNTAANQPPVAPRGTKAIGQFTPHTTDSELIDKLRSVSQEGDKTASSIDS
ncbi:hypothetical protein IQ266_19705 [filamentous cyanobacterium LEGE 11480]|uniref:DnaD domain-containing protein n=1 Tax=Romeriopsis navalis LEGE 11480 TaxID=2777977 RepID=A0A928Z3Y0_9CYAN|nr:hypothetical protein [Romeriopsis navalis]MBE9031966.1 hypothetical protein [Romeriopsis navalis LEGE 11480]